MKKTIPILFLIGLLLSFTNSQKETLSTEEDVAYGNSISNVVNQFTDQHYRWPSSPQELLNYYDDWAIVFLQDEYGMTEDEAKLTFRDTILNYTFTKFPKGHFYGFPEGRFVCLNFINKHPNLLFLDKDTCLVIVDSTVTVKQDDGTEKIFNGVAFSDIFSPVLCPDLDIKKKAEETEIVAEDQPIDKSQKGWQVSVRPAHVNDFISIRTQVHFFDNDDNPIGEDSTLRANFFKGIRNELLNIDVKSRFVGLPMIYERGKGLSIACKRYHHFKNEINGWDTIEKCIERFAKENNIKQINFSDYWVGIW
ncbi:MAG: hypothetical protein MJZ02_09595 [Paludibacteraceae bacterium]|nr:hypothetical protein [Paludibacteraceae bacterium]